MSDSQVEKRLKHLEELVRDAAKSLEESRRENGRLKSELKRFQETNLRLESEFRRFKALSQRQETVRGRLERIARRLDKALELSGGGGA